MRTGLQVSLVILMAMILAKITPAQASQRTAESHKQQWSEIASTSGAPAAIQESIDRMIARENREIEVIKRGIDIAITQANITFRVTKSKRLAKLHKSPEWIKLDSVG